MDRRELLGAVTLGAAGFVALGSSRTVAAAPLADDPKMKRMMDDCLKACKSCASLCEETFHHCFGLVMLGKKEHARAAEYALDCADFCALSVKMMLRQSDLMTASCGACAEACKKCGDECAKFDGELMKKCTEACRECEKTCAAMATMHHHQE